MAITRSKLDFKRVEVNTVNGTQIYWELTKSFVNFQLIWTGYQQAEHLRYAKKNSNQVVLKIFKLVLKHKLSSNSEGASLRREHSTEDGGCPN